MQPIFLQLAGSIIYRFIVTVKSGQFIQQFLNLIFLRTGIRTPKTYT